MACWCDMLLYILPFIGFALFLIRRLMRWNYNYWNKKGVAGPKPTFLFGNFWPTMQGNESLGETCMNIYFQTRDIPHAGAYMLMRKIWVVNHPELIKTILVKDFAHFTDHSPMLSETAEGGRSSESNCLPPSHRVRSGICSTQ